MEVRDRASPAERPIRNDGSARHHGACRDSSERRVLSLVSCNARPHRGAHVAAALRLLTTISVPRFNRTARRHASEPERGTGPATRKTTAPNQRSNCRAVYEHNSNAPRPLVLVVDDSNFPPSVWNRVKNLVAFRMHRPQPDGTTLVDAPIYIVRNSAIYLKADAALRNGTTNDEYVWCLLAAVLAHEGAHKAPMTEHEALIAEAEQLRRCLFEGHLHTGSGWSAGAYLMKVEAKLRQPREHY